MKKRHAAISALCLAGLLSVQSSSLGNYAETRVQTKFVFNASGQVTQITDSSGKVLVTLSYDTNGNINGVTGTKNVQFAYDNNGNLVGVSVK